MGSFFINEFLEHIKYHKKYSENTFLAYKQDLAELSEFLDNSYEINTPNNITNEIIRTWISKLIERKKNPATVKRKISTIKSYFKYLIKEKIITKNPATNIAKLKVAKKLPSVVNTEVMNRIINDVPKDNYSEYLSYLIICILFGTGIRRSELISLTENNVDTNLRLIKVLGKRNKERIIPITEELAAQIEMLREIKLQNKLNSHYLLVTPKGKKISVTHIYNVVKNKLSSNNVNGRKSPHILRHAYATGLLKNGAELLSVKELLGHSSLASTQVYTHVNIEDLKKIYKKNHPKQ